MKSKPETPIPTPDPTSFINGSYELISNGRFRHYEILSPDNGISECTYYIESNETLSKNKFDLVLRKGNSKGEILGVAKRHLRGFTIGIGNPYPDASGKGHHQVAVTGTGSELGEDGGGAGQPEMIWEKLERPEKYSHKVYHFDFGSGLQRRRYTFRKTNGRMGRLQSMEMRVGGVDEGDGELVGKWIGRSRWNMKDGSLFVSSGMKMDGLETVVCLSTFAIIESQVRRSKG